MSPNINHAQGYTKAFGKMLSNDTLGFVVATAIACLAVLLLNKGSFIPLIIASAGASFVALMIASILKPLPHVGEQPEPTRFFKQLQSGVHVVKRTRTIFALLVLGLLTLNGEYFLRQTYQPYFQTMAVPALFLGLALSAGKLMNFVAIRNVHRLEKYFTVDKILLWINLVLGSAFVLFSLVHSALMVVATFMIIQAVMNAQQPIVSDYINQKIQSGQRTTTLSTVSFIQSVGQIMARVLLGIAVGVIGLRHTYLVHGSYILVGGIIGVWYIRRCGCVHRIKQHFEKPALEPV
jgi:hypothetical protein